MRERARKKNQEKGVHVGRTKKRMQRVKSRKRQEVGERVWKGRDRGGKRERDRVKWCRKMGNNMRGNWT